jgi:hypothetical protein
LYNNNDVQRSCCAGGRSQWALREALSEDNRLVLIGATSAFLEDAAAYESPLYVLGVRQGMELFERGCRLGSPVACKNHDALRDARDQ